MALISLSETHYVSKVFVVGVVVVVVVGGGGVVVVVFVVIGGGGDVVCVRACVRVCVCVTRTPCSNFSYNRDLRTGKSYNYSLFLVSCNSTKG